MLTCTKPFMYIMHSVKNYIPALQLKSFTYIYAQTVWGDTLNTKRVEGTYEKREGL